MTIIATDDKCHLQVIEDTKASGSYVLALHRQEKLKSFRIGINNFLLHLASSAGTNAAVSLCPSVESQKSSRQTSPVNHELNCYSLQLRSRSAQRSQNSIIRVRALLCHESRPLIASSTMSSRRRDKAYSSRLLSCHQKYGRAWTHPCRERVESSDPLRPWCVPPCQDGPCPVSRRCQGGQVVA